MSKNVNASRKKKRKNKNTNVLNLGFNYGLASDESKPTARPEQETKQQGVPPPQKASAAKASVENHAKKASEVVPAPPSEPAAEARQPSHGHSANPPGTPPAVSPLTEPSLSEELRAEPSEKPAKSVLGDAGVNDSSAHSNSDGSSSNSSDGTLSIPALSLSSPTIMDITSSIKQPQEEDIAMLGTSPLFTLPAQQPLSSYPSSEAYSSIEPPVGIKTDTQPVSFWQIPETQPYQHDSILPNAQFQDSFTGGSLGLNFLNESSGFSPINGFGPNRADGLENFGFPGSPISVGLEQPATFQNDLSGGGDSTVGELDKFRAFDAQQQSLPVVQPAVHSPTFTPKAAKTVAPVLRSPPAASAAATAGVDRHDEAQPGKPVARTELPSVMSPKKKTQICRYFLQGNCVRGESCSFSHDLSGRDHTGAGLSGSEGSGVQITKSSSRSSQDSGSGEKQSSSNATQRKQSHRQTVSEEAASNDPEALRGHIYDMCKDQQGCRSLQKLLDENSPRITSMVFDEVLDHIVKLMSDPFGNYLCQKLLEYCTPAQRLQIVKKASGDLVSISVNMHGTRAAQKLIDLLQNEEEISIVRAALADHVVQLIQDLNGNHVIQRCLNKLPPSSTQFIYDAVTREGNAIAVATHRHGCCVLQRCIDSASDEQKMQLVNEVIRNALPLVKDPFGNYVVQYVLDLPFPGIAARLVRTLKGHIAELSMQKFSSNVMEMIVKKSDSVTRDEIINDIIHFDNFKSLISDPYANYVIQTCMSFASIFSFFFSFSLFYTILYILLFHH